MYNRTLSFFSAFLILALVLVAGCDTGVDPGVEEEMTTVQFDRTSITSGRSGSVLIPVRLNNPRETEVTVEILYANEVSETDPSEFIFPDDAIIGDGNAYVAGMVTFPSNSEDGDVIDFELPLNEESEVEEQLDAIFALQRAQNASVGSNRELVLSLGSIILFEEDFSDGSLEPFTTVGINGDPTWSASSFGENTFAQANAFGADEPSNDWLISPAIDFTETTGHSLSFITSRNFSDDGLDQPLSVKISVDYDGEGNPEDFEWTDITDRADGYSEGGRDRVDSGRLDLSDSDFVSDSVYVAFQYRSSGTGGGSTEEWRIDDVVVRGQ